MVKYYPAGGAMRTGTGTGTTNLIYLLGDHLGSTSFSYDAENRLIAVTQDGITFATFLYDGDGKRVRATVGGRTTVFVGGGYEIELSSGVDGMYWSFDEGSGTVLSEASGFGEQGQVQGATWTSGLTGKALDFDGTNDYVQFSTEPAIQGALTVSAWVRSESGPVACGRVVASTYKWNSGSPNERGWMLGNTCGGSGDSSFSFRVYDNAGSQAVATLSNFFTTYDDQWVHVAGIFIPGQSAALYVNGVKVAEDTTSVPTSIGLSGIFRVGGRADSTSQGRWDGQIDNLQITGRALSAAEIQELLIVGVWRFDENVGAQASDASGYGQTGAVQNGTWTTGQLGQALDFEADTANQIVQFDTEPKLEGPLTVSAWVRPESGPTGIGRMVVSTYEYNGGGANQRGWYLGLTYGSTNEFRFQVYDDLGGTANATLSNFFTTYQNQWVHVAGVFIPGQSVALYINGVKVSEDTTSVPVRIGVSGVFKIGARADNTTQGFWDGKIDDVRLMGRALTAPEIQSLMNTAYTGQPQFQNQAVVKKYYPSAMRVNGKLYFLFSDHLGSNSVVTNASGSKVAENRYTPWGELRPAGSNVLPTNYTYTGQYSYQDDFGLMFYNARWYDSSLGRFAQADTVVPGAGNPMAWDRYAYTENNPVRYTDPSGHVTCGDGSSAAAHLEGAECDANGNWITPKANYNQCHRRPSSCLTYKAHQGVYIGNPVPWQAPDEGDPNDPNVPRNTLLGQAEGWAGVTMSFEPSAAALYAYLNPPEDNLFVNLQIDYYGSGFEVYLSIENHSDYDIYFQITVEIYDPSSGDQSPPINTTFIGPSSDKLPHSSSFTIAGIPSSIPQISNTHNVNVTVNFLGLAPGDKQTASVSYNVLGLSNWPRVR